MFPVSMVYQFLWKYLHKRHRTASTSVTGTTITTSWIQDFHQSLTPPTVLQNRQDIALLLEGGSTWFETLDFTNAELHYALQSIKHNTTPGVDAITYNHLRDLPSDILDLLLDEFNRIWHTSHIPTIWKTHLVVPIKKPHKPVGLATSYRPITLTSCVGKILEKLLLARLEWWVEHHQLFPPSMTGFRKGYNTMDSVANLVIDIWNAFQHRE